MKLGEIPLHTLSSITPIEMCMMLDRSLDLSILHKKSLLDDCLICKFVALSQSIHNSKFHSSVQPLQFLAKMTDSDGFDCKLLRAGDLPLQEHVPDQPVCPTTHHNPQPLHRKSVTA
uniref:Uncharacterized protein n=1 Tax=Compsopogon caeruleus TaxID=31354 RepID=A0A6T6BHH5_9RHOD